MAGQEAGRWQRAHAEFERVSSDSTAPTVSFPPLRRAKIILQQLAAALDRVTVVPHIWAGTPDMLASDAG